MSARAESSEVDADQRFGDELPIGSQLLRGQYTITQFLNAGGFGITYLAQDSLDRIVVIKECFPSSMCCRTKEVVRVRSRGHATDFETIVRLFGQEARALAKLDHPNIVGVHQVFEDNHTAYMALDLVKGRDLLDIVEEEPERLTPETVKDLLMTILDAVSYIHDAGVLHRDISPDNILLAENGEPVLIDFGAAREEATRVSRVLSAQNTVKDGYSPQEFYISGSTQSNASDLYALGATFYHLITGSAPPVSQVRLAAVAEKRPDPYEPLSGRIEGYDRFFLEAIDQTLEIFPKDRLQTAEEWITQIDTSRRRQAAQRKAETDVKMQRAIQKLVQETNRQVREAQARESKATEKPQPKFVRPKPLFPDLMGPPPPERKEIAPPEPQSSDTSKMEINDAGRAEEIAQPATNGAKTNGAAEPAQDQVGVNGTAQKAVTARLAKPGLEGATSPRKRLFERVLSVSLRRQTQGNEQQEPIVGKVER